jgi:myo-inositol-1(or 4)-monophosphatase
MNPLQEFLDFAVDAATQAGRIALGHYRTGVDVEWKADRSPVTVADRVVEELLRKRIEHRYPDHGIVGEEGGEVRRDATRRWIIDPIDGTQSFIRGVPLWGVLIGLEVGGEMIVGVVSMPAVNETVSAAKGLGCRLNGHPVHVSGVERLDEALVVYTDSHELARRRPAAWATLQARSRLQRGWGDCYGHLLVATGRADVMLDPVMSPWDCAPLLPILGEAGGTFTDWEGQATIYGGHAISTNGRLFDEVMKTITERTQT